MVRKFSYDLVGLKIGDVLKCTYRAAPGQCGAVAACRLCGLKRSVDRVRDTAGKVTNVPIKLDRELGASERFRITAQKVSDSVFLVIEASLADDVGSGYGNPPSGA